MNLYDQMMFLLRLDQASFGYTRVDIHEFQRRMIRCLDLSGVFDRLKNFLCTITFSQQPHRSDKLNSEVLPGY